MYQAMTSLGFASESPYRGPIKLEGDPKGASVIVLGAGLAGMTAALELGRAGYKVEILEYNNRAGGRNWSIRGGDSYTELGGATQNCSFDEGLYLNPGPWRIPYHHHAILDYCRRFGVTLEPFIQLNHNAYLHSATAFGGKPQRIREIKADFEGAIAELLAKATRQGALDEAVSKEDQEILLEALRDNGGLDSDFRFTAGDMSAAYRGYARDPGGGLTAEPLNGAPIGLHDLLTSRLWRGLPSFSLYDFQTTMFQPVGGMGRIGEAFARQIPNVIRYGAKVTAIHQDERRVTVTFEDLGRGGIVQEASADWCVCALPLSILSQLPINVSPPMKAAIDAVPYAAVVKTGLFAHITHPEDLPEMQARTRALFDGHVSHCAFERRDLLKDGAAIWGRTTLTLLRQAHGEFKRCIGVVDDVTDRRETEQALRDAPRRLRRLAAVWPPSWSPPMMRSSARPSRV